MSPVRTRPRWFPEGTPWHERGDPVGAEEMRRIVDGLDDWRARQPERDRLRENVKLHLEMLRGGEMLRAYWRATIPGYKPPPVTNLEPF